MFAAAYALERALGAEAHHDDATRSRHDGMRWWSDSRCTCSSRRATKVFCGCSTEFGAPPNVNTCPVCLALPGALPVLNEHAVDLAIRAALALGCRSSGLDLRAEELLLSRPAERLSDLAVRPTAATEGCVEIGGAARRAADLIGVTRVHMEEDAGKSIHDRFPVSPRSTSIGRVPLDRDRQRARHRGPREADAYFATLKQILSIST